MEAYHAPFSVVHELYRIVFLRDQDARERQEAEALEREKAELEAQRRQPAQNRSKVKPASLPPRKQLQASSYQGFDEGDLEELMEEM